MLPQMVTVQAKDIATAELSLPGKLRVLTTLKIGRTTTTGKITKGCQETEGVLHVKVSSEMINQTNQLLCITHNLVYNQQI